MAKIGIIGGSGIYELLENPKYIESNTNYGKTSDKIAIGDISGIEVAFLPRHGTKHTIPPHKIPYKANIDALYGLGVERIIATGAVGSLSPDYEPGSFVFFDQFVNMTSCRDDTFFNDNEVVHISTAEPYCPEMREIAIGLAGRLGLKHRRDGTVAVINGPRFSTKAESRMFANMGFDVINMTQYPEAALARERGMCYLGIGVVTDYDAGLEGRSDIKPVSMDEINNIFSQNVGKLKSFINALIPLIPEKRGCACAHALDNAKVNV